MSPDEKDGSKCDERSEFPKTLESNGNAGNISNDTQGSAKRAIRDKPRQPFSPDIVTKPDANFKGKRKDHRAFQRKQKGPKCLTESVKISKKARKSILTKESLTVPETSFSRSAHKRNTNKGKVVKQEGLQSKLDGNYQQEIPTKPGQSERVQNYLNAKLDSVLTCIGGLQAEINALKNASANSATTAYMPSLSPHLQVGCHLFPL